jgi:hypothetical protein
LKNRKGQSCLLIVSLALLSSIVTACASTPDYLRIEERQSHSNARAAAYAADGFTMDHRSPDQRPNRAWDFYYKHCALVSRNPYPNRAEYDCADPK